MDQIIGLHPREILDSRGNPTVEVEVSTSRGFIGRSAAPSGASTGSAEAVELRDTFAKRYAGRGVQTALTNIQERIAPALLGLNPADQAMIDQRLQGLDPSPNKGSLGGNATVAVSLACSHAGAQSRGLPLFRHLREIYREAFSTLDAPLPEMFDSWRIPVPMTNILSGGKHAGGNLDFQDFLVIPRGAADYPTALEWIVRVYHQTGELLRARGFEGTLVGDEGGFGPRLPDNHTACRLLVEAIANAGLEPGRDMVLAIDVASTQFYTQGQYRLRAFGQQDWTSAQMQDHLVSLVEEFPIAVIEDGLAEEDWSAWQQLTHKLGSRVLLVGDDLFATQQSRLLQGVSQRAGNAILIKVNQVGTLYQAMKTMAHAVYSGYAAIVSARSGETEDTTIADLAVATSATHIKIGSIARGERLCKYNQLLRIYEEISGRG